MSAAPVAVAVPLAVRRQEHRAVTLAAAAGGIDWEAGTGDSSAFEAR